MLDEKELPEELTRSWLETFVIGYDLCPFARQPYKKGQVRFRVLEGEGPTLMEQIIQEMIHLAEADTEDTATSVLILKDAAKVFTDYLELINSAQDELIANDLEGQVQIATFHPDYQFAGTDFADAENFTNRSPYPLVHLLREDLLETALTHYPDPESIPERNIRLMNEHGAAFWIKLLKEL